MKLQWFVEVNGDKTLQYKNEDDEYWRDVDIELEVAKEYEIQGKLRDRIRELENDYKILQGLK